MLKVGIFVMFLYNFNLKNCFYNGIWLIVKCFINWDIEVKVLMGKKCGLCNYNKVKNKIK